MEFSEKLIRLFESDQEGLFNPRQKIQAPTPDDRLVASFKEIVEFVERNGRMPELESGNISEASLASRLNSIRNNHKKVEALKAIDSLGLLEMPEAPKSMNDLFEKDTFGIFDGAGNEILNIKNIPMKHQYYKAEEIAKRKPAKDFDKFKPLFIEQQRLLAFGDNKLTPFVTVDQIRLGGFYVQDGIMLYVSEFGKLERKTNYSQQRMRVIYENGVESNMYRRSLAQRLYEGCYAVVDKSYTGEYSSLDEKDNIKGYIYVLKSKSEDPKIITIKDLHKIGFSTTPVAQRIKDAEKDPTYLMAPVEVVNSYILTGEYNPQKVEHFIHRIFSDAKVEMNIIDNTGREYTPSEWYSVPSLVIEQVANLLQNGEIINYHYDASQQRILPNKISQW